MEPRPSRTVRGFTLVELLVVIAIIGILVALLLPAIQAAREAARRSECMNHLKQIGVAIQTHHDVKKHFPQGRNGREQESVSWAYFILPQIEEQALYDAFVDGVRVDDNQNAKTMRTPIQIYACPSRRPPAADRNFDNNNQPPVVLAAASLGDYAANAGLEEDTGLEDEDWEDPLTRKVIDISLAGPIYTGSAVNARKVIDGLSKTLAVGEKHIRPVESDWDEEMVHFEQGDTAFLAGDNIFAILRCSEEGLATGPDDDEDEKFGGPHPGVTMFVYLDGHADGLSNDTDVAILKGLSTIGGEEVVRTN
jgi:prepilin-type N-terminal cleavage/methylation domain-containing protein/prepilin-type processing-associated H-X9-DG protein